MPTVWLNGSFIEEDAAAVSLRDTGLLHAAGVFTTMRSAGGKIFRLDRHLARLRQSCDALFIPLTFKDQPLAAAISELLAQNNFQDARLRLTVTRGSAQQDPLHGLRLQPNVFITATSLEPYPKEFYDNGMTVVVLDDQKLNPYDIQAGHKTLNYFSRLAALRSANQRAAGEALWFNVHNFLQSGSISNIFIVSEGKLLTPPTPADLQDPAIASATAYPKSAVLPGITRGAILDLAKEAGIEARIGSITINQLLAADEAFITNSIMQVMPVCRIERQAIGNDKPGPVTRQLAEAYRKEVEKE